jgi:hypothetical protein
MAQRVVVQLDCDMDNKSGADVETVVFGFEGTSYELELCGKHRKKLADALTELIASARKASMPRTRAATAKARTRPASRREENGEIRAWAAASGIKVSERGRIAADVIAQYNAASNGRGKAITTPKFKDGSAAL